MPRLSRFAIMEKNKEMIAAPFKSMDSSFLTLRELTSLIDKQKASWSLPNKTSAIEVIHFLAEEGVLKEVAIKSPHRSTTRYLTGSPSVYELALSITPNCYLTHYSAVFLHGLTNNVPKIIYTNVEQTTHGSKNNDDDEMEQKNIDLAFSRPMRKSNQIAAFELDGMKYQVYMLNGKNHERLEVKKYPLPDADIMVPMTSIERTLLDIVVRPNYAGGVDEVLETFKAAKGRFSVNKLLVTLKKMDFKYPYHQLIGFYLEKAGYSEDILNLLNQFEIKYNFYLTYQMRDKQFSNRWRVYYPKGLTQ